MRLGGLVIKVSFAARSYISSQQSPRFPFCLSCRRGLLSIVDYSSLVLRRRRLNSHMRALRRKSKAVGETKGHRLDTASAPHGPEL